MRNKLKAIGVSILRWCWRHKIWTACLIVLGVLSITPIIIVTRTWFIVHTDQRPCAMPVSYTLEEQTEGFTCGVHALSTVYKAYGLDPEAERIRWRLGVDTKAVAWMGDSTGALLPDMWMVLVQDYFDVHEMISYDGWAWSELGAHLDRGHPAVLLIKRRENGNLHWVVATRTLPSDMIEIYDSLFDESYAETPDFLSYHIVTAMLVKPTIDGEMSMSTVDAHLAGMDALTKATKRIKVLEEKND